MKAEIKLDLAAQTIESAAPNARPLLEQAQKSLGFVPNMYAYMANAPELLSTYMHGYELFRAESGFTPVEQEVVFLSISFENGCDYCMAAHSLVAAAMSKVPAEVTEAIRNGQPIPDARLQTLSSFTRTLLNKRGLPSKEEVEAFRQAGYSDKQVLDLLLAIAVKTLSNYSNHLTHTPVDAAFAKFAWQAPACQTGSSCQTA